MNECMWPPRHTPAVYCRCGVSLEGDRGVTRSIAVGVRTSLAFCFPFSLARAPLFPFALRPRVVRPPSSNESESDPELIGLAGSVCVVDYL